MIDRDAVVKSSALEAEHRALSRSATLVGCHRPGSAASSSRRTAAQRWPICWAGRVILRRACCSSASTPGLWTAAADAHFARRGNRFWPALHAAGITPRLVDASGGMTAADRQMVVGLGIGITNLVPIATARADELTAAQLREGGRALLDLVARIHPDGRRRAGRDRVSTGLRRAHDVGRPATADARRRRAVGAAQPERPERPRDAGQLGCRLPRRSSRGRRVDVTHALPVTTDFCWRAVGGDATLAR